MKFRLLSNGHVDASGKKFNKGDVIESSENLAKKFRNKFEVLTRKAEKPAAQRISRKSKKKSKAKKAKAKKPVGGPLGADATEEHPTAKAEGLKVYVRDGGLFLHEPDSDKPINSDPLAPDAVEGAVKDYLEK